MLEGKIQEGTASLFKSISLNNKSNPISKIDKLDQMCDTIGLIMKSENGCMTEVGGELH